MGDCLWTGKPSRYVTSHLGQLSLPFIRGRSVHYRPVWLGLRRGVFTCLGWQVTLSDPICQVTLCSCVMGYLPLTAIHYLCNMHLCELLCKGRYINLRFDCFDWLSFSVKNFCTVYTSVCITVQFWITLHSLYFCAFMQGSHSHFLWFRKDWNVASLWRGQRVLHVLMVWEKMLWRC